MLLVHTYVYISISIYVSDLASLPLSLPVPPLCVRSLARPPERLAEPSATDMMDGGWSRTRKEVVKYPNECVRVRYYKPMTLLLFRVLWGVGMPRAREVRDGDEPHERGTRHTDRQTETERGGGEGERKRRHG